MHEFVGAIDQGTTSTRFMIFDHDARVVASHQLEHRQIFPNPGWVEHDPLEIVERTAAVMHGALSTAGLGPADLAAIGLANQRETTVIWDRATGLPLANAIVWQDTRSDRIAGSLRGAREVSWYAEKPGYRLRHIFQPASCNGHSRT
jgi:glycerol kinase